MMAVLSPQDRTQFYDRLLAIYRPYFGRIAASDAHLRQMASDNLDAARSLEQLQLFAAATGSSLAGKRLLEVGSGTGMTVATARKLLGAEAFGIEHDGDEYQGSLRVSWDILACAGLDPSIIRKGAGEAIPYPDGHFDAVYSSNVLEHVDDPPRVLAEIVRVLRPGGYAQIVVPNYGSWWEGHYGMVWPPHCPAWLAKLYVRLRGRDPQFIDTLQLVTRGKLERWLAPHREAVDVLDWGVALWEARVRGLDFSEYAALGGLKNILRILHAMKVVPLLIAIGKLLHWETPLVLTLRKRSPPAPTERSRPA
jgi:SAM-dependent methyltransferase